MERVRSRVGVAEGRGIWPWLEGAESSNGLKQMMLNTPTYGNTSCRSDVVPKLSWKSI